MNSLNPQSVHALQVPDTYLVAVMDILGMRKAIERATSQQDLKKMADIFSRAKTIAQEYQMKALLHEANECSSIGTAGENCKDIEDLYNRSVRTSFSDTLVITLNLSNFRKIKLRSASERLATIMFFMKVQYTAFALFECGFPIRGAIEIGSLVFRDDFIFGKAFKDAYESSEKLNFAGVVVSDDVVNEFEWLNCFTIKTLKKSKLTIPLNPKKANGKSETNAYCLDWLGVSETPAKTDVLSLEQELYIKFSMHNKGLNSSVIEKIKNTKRVFFEMAAIAQHEHETNAILSMPV